MDACIVGWGHTPFGRREEDLEGLIDVRAPEPRKRGPYKERNSN